MSNNLDDLLERLRARAADPARRTSARPNRFTSTVQTLDVGGMLTMLRGVSADLNRVMAANREGRIDAAATARADALHEAMTTQVRGDLPAPASPAELGDAEAALGIALPEVLRRAYTEIANGGFGPGEGLLPLREVVAAYRRLRSGDELPRGRRWPDGLVPVISVDPGFDCVETSTGQIVAWDPEGLSERSNQARFAKSFRLVAPSAEAWLETWVGSRTQEELLAERMRRTQVEMARQARASIAKKTPDERAAMGLPEVGWERVVWGGIGLDDEDTDAGA